MKNMKRSVIIIICCFTTILNAQSPLYLEVGDCANEIHYKSTNNEGATSEYFDYQFALNDYEAVTLTVSKYAIEDLNVDAIRSYQITACGSSALKTKLSIELIEKIKKSEQDVYLVKKTTTGYKIGKVSTATYSVYLPEDNYLRVVSSDFSFDFDGNNHYEPGAELKTGNGEESFIFYTQQTERCYKKTTFMLVPVNFMETANLEYILGIGMVRKYSDESETRLMAINGQNFDSYLTTFCNETSVFYNLETPKVEQPIENEINMSLVDTPVESWISDEEGTAKGGNDAIYESTPAMTETVEEDNKFNKTPALNYEYLKNSAVEIDNTETEMQLPIDANHHLVQKGETLYSISKKYNLSTLDIKTLNNLEDNIIEIGQQLRIKK